ncbi:MAG: 4Fe-4S dicluster domain-containing protein [Acidobacteriota bacterium]
MEPLYAPDSRLRYRLLKIYAWKEVELLRLLFRVGHWRILRHAAIRKPLYYLFLHLLGTRALVAQAATLAEACEFIDALPDQFAIAVGPCRCRAGNHNCTHAVTTDIVIRETAPIWYRDLFPNDYRVIGKAEAKEICRASRNAGMIQCIDRHMYIRNSENYFVICNCCKESCVPLVAYRLFKQEPFTFLPSPSVVSINVDRCRGCGTCVAVCPFEERTLEAETGVAKVQNCQGCGLCVDTCPTGASRMIARGRFT